MIGAFDANQSAMSPSPSILLIDDDAEIGELIRGILSPYGVIHAVDKTQAFAILEKQNVDLILLDIGLPETNGFQVCSEIVAHPSFQEIPVVILSAHSAKPEIALGLGSGADDYIVKPFDSLEFKYRVDARLRRRRIHSKTYTIGPFHFDVEFHRCKYHAGTDERSFDFTTAEFLIFFLLAKHPDHVFTREEVVHELWKRKGLSIDPKGINTHIAHLRRKLGPFKNVIQSFYGRGYCFKLA